MNPVPCKKDTGYLSIESTKEVNYVVFRSLTGAMLFKGIINKTTIRTKVIDKHPRDFRLKVVVVVTDADNKPQVEHLELVFLNAKDQHNFKTCFEQL